MKEIVIEVTPDGKVELVTKGFAGKECYDASRAIELALGVVVEDKKTPEYYKKVTTTAKVKNGR